MENDHDIECCCNECMAGPAPKRPTPMNHTPAQGTGTPRTDAFFNRKPSGRSFLEEVRETMAQLETELTASEDKRKETAKDFECAFRLVRKENDDLRALTAALSSHAEWQQALSKAAKALERCDYSAASAILFPYLKMP